MADTRHKKQSGSMLCCVKHFRNFLADDFAKHSALTPNGVLTAHTEWLLGVRLGHFSTTCALFIEDCEGRWLSGCRSLVAEHCLHKPFKCQFSHTLYSHVWHK